MTALRDGPSPGSVPPQDERNSIRFAGYAAVFDRADRSGDVVRKGAFARFRERIVPLLREHRGPAIGTARVIGEDAKGLRVIGTVAAGEAVAAGAGLSFGYRVLGARPGRELTDLDLIEVSLVGFPMQPLARVHAVE